MQEATWARPAARSSLTVATQVLPRTPHHPRRGGGARRESAVGVEPAVLAFLVLPLAALVLRLEPGRLIPAWAAGRWCRP